MASGASQGVDPVLGCPLGQLRSSTALSPDSCHRSLPLLPSWRPVRLDTLPVVPPESGVGRGTAGACRGVQRRRARDSRSAGPAPMDGHRSPSFALVRHSERRAGRLSAGGRRQESPLRPPGNGNFLARPPVELARAAPQAPLVSVQLADATVGRLPGQSRHELRGRNTPEAEGTMGGSKGDREGRRKRGVQADVAVAALGDDWWAEAEFVDLSRTQTTDAGLRQSSRR